MSGIRERLSQIRGEISPRRINQVIHPTEIDAEKILRMMPREVKARTETSNGDVKVQKRRRFLKGLRALIDKGFDPLKLLHMDEECVDNQGRINEERLRSIINGEHDD